MKGCVLSFRCAFCDARIKLVCVQGQATEGPSDRHSSLGLRPHLCRPKRRSGYELNSGIDVVEHPTAR